MKLLKLRYLFILAVLFGSSGCTEFNPVTQRQDFIMYSTEKEVAIGKNVAKQVEKEYKLVQNPNVVERITEIGRKIAAVSDRRDIEYFVSVIQAKEEERQDGADINAFALPGGYIYLYDGIVDFVDNDDQLACIIAHEVSHIVAKHGIKRLQASMGYTLLGLAAIGTGDVDVIAGVNEAFLNILLAYSREDEILADKIGARYAKLAGYDPHAMIDFLEKLKDKQRKEPLRARSVYRTHPYFSERIAAIKQELGIPFTISDYVHMSTE